MVNALLGLILNSSSALRSNPNQEKLESVDLQRFQVFLVVRLIGNCCKYIGIF
jgi:hypothetical protein